MSAWAASTSGPRLVPINAVAFVRPAPTPGSWTGSLDRDPSLHAFEPAASCQWSGATVSGSALQNALPRIRLRGSASQNPVPGIRSRGEEASDPENDPPSGIGSPLCSLQQVSGPPLLQGKRAPNKSQHLIPHSLFSLPGSPLRCPDHELAPAVPHAGNADDARRSIDGVQHALGVSGVWTDRDL